MVTYNKILKHMSRRVSMTLLVAVSSLSTLLADNRISVQDITIVNGQTAVVSVKMENDPDVIGLSSDIVLPEGLSIVPLADPFVPGQQVNFALNASRTYDPELLYNEQTVQRHVVRDSYKEDARTYRMSITHNRFMPFIGNSGDEIYKFKIQASNALPETSFIDFENVLFDKKNGTTITEVGQDDFKVKVNKVAVAPPTAILTADPGITIRPGADNRQIVTVSMNNNFEVEGMSVKIQLPTGLKFVTGVEGFQAGISLNPRAKGFTPTLNRESGVLTLENELGTGRILAGEGEIFAFLVEADNNLLAKDKIVINTARLTTHFQGLIKTVIGNDVNIAVKNPYVAEKELAELDRVAGLQEQVDALIVPQPVRNCPDEEVKGLVAKADSAKAAAQEFVDAVEAIVDARIADGTVATDAAQAEINEAAQAAQDAIDRAQAAIDDAVELYNQKYGIVEEAYKRLSADIDRLQYKLNNAEDDIERNYPEIAADFADDEAAIQQMIDNLRDSILVLKANQELTDESKLDPAQVKAITDAIIKLQQDVKAAQEKIEADKKKFAEDKAAMTEEVDGLQDQLDDLQDALDAIQNVSDEAKEPAQDMIDAIQDQINAIVDALDDAENLDDLDAIADLILDVENNLDAVAQVIDDLKISNVQGDITGEGDVDIDDYYALLDVVMDQDFIDALDPDSKEFKKYDVNRNGKINSADLAAIINIYVYGNVEGPSGVRQMTGMDAVMSVSGSKRMALNLGNAAGYIGAQTDIVLPEGMSITGVELGELAGNHKVTTRKQKDGSVRILVSSTSNALFNGAEGTLVYINVAGNGTASFRNTSLISADAQSVDLTISAAETTGISSVSAKADSQATVYSLGGRLMNAVKKGVNIIRRADGTTKKVIR